MKKIIFFSVLAFILVCVCIGTGFAQNLDPKVVKKDSLLKVKLKKKGFDANYTRISGKRSKWLNELLPLSAKNSTHLSGQAIDILVGDVNKDDKKNEQDVKIVIACLEEIEQENPALVGGLGTYLTKNKISRKMVHFDVRGTKARWNN